MNLNILHISDFHFQKGKTKEYQNRTSEMISSISGKKIDFIVFSGDLVFKGENSYTEASSVLIDDLLKNLNLTKDKILIVPGNHDLNRKNELQMVKDSIEQKRSSEDIEVFCSDVEQLKASLSRFEEFNSFLNEFYKDVEGIEIRPLYIRINTKINGKDIVAIGLNSAWRCIESEKDRGNLIYPTFMAEEAFFKVQESDFVICAMHHNLRDFKEYIENDLVDIIYPNCNIIFSGHYHRERTSIESYNDGGLIHAISAAIYNRHDRYSEYGFCIWTLDTEIQEATIEKFLLEKGKFVAQKSQVLSLPMDEDKKEQNEIRKLLRLRLNEAKIRADKDFVTGEQADQQPGATFLSLFKNPIIKKECVEELVAKQSKGTKQSINDIIASKESICLVGTNKCGKTSILRKIQIETLDDVYKDKILPIFIQYKDFKQGKKLDLQKEVADYLNMSRGDAKKFMNSHTILLLVDDMNVKDKIFGDMISTELDQIPNSKLIATCENFFGKVNLTIKVKGKEMEQLFIHDIGEQEIHELTLSWPHIPEANKYHVEDKIVSICRHMNIPFNFWTVSLFLWIFEKTDPQNIHNNFELVKLYIDELMDKTGIIRDQSITIDYEDLKLFLAELAYLLYKQSGYRISEEDFFEFIKSYREKNKKFDIGAIELINLLEKKQIIENTDKFYTFRLNGVFEFFLALQMQENEEFRKEVLANQTMLLSFGNELEFYAGFRRKDFDSIKTIYSNIKDLLKDFVAVDGYEDVDSRLSQSFSMNGNAEIARILFSAVKEVADEEKRELTYKDINVLPIDNLTSIQEKKPTDLSKPLDTGDVEKALFILGRVFRNSNICDNEEISDDMLDYILTGVCNLGFKHSEGMEFASLKLKGETIKQLIEKINNIMPIVVAAFLNDAICQRNLARVFIDKLNKYYANPKGNEYRIFLLTQILTYLDLTDFSYWEKSLNITTMKALRFAYYNEAILIRFKYPEVRSIANNAESQINFLLPEFNIAHKSYGDVLRDVFNKTDNNDKARRHIRKKHYKNLSKKKHPKRK